MAIGVAVVAWAAVVLSAIETGMTDKARITSRARINRNRTDRPLSSRRADLFGRTLIVLRFTLVRILRVVNTIALDTMSGSSAY